MSDLSVPSVNIDIYSLHRVLSSDTLTDVQKFNFMQKNSDDIKSVMQTYLSSDEYSMIMMNRPLLRFKPLLNAFTKRGDKILMAKALGLPENEIKLYMQRVGRLYNKMGSFDFLPPEQVKVLQTYAYRHGTKKALMRFFNNELTHAADLEKTIQHSLSYNTGGVADYFSRPIHRMDDKLFVDLFGLINKHIRSAQTNNKISEAEAVELSVWVLQQLYVIQNNSKPFRKKAESVKI